MAFLSSTANQVSANNPTVKSDDKPTVDKAPAEKPIDKGTSPKEPVKTDAPKVDNKNKEDKQVDSKQPELKSPSEKKADPATPPSPPKLVPQSEAAFEQEIRPLLVKYCGDCHSEDEKNAALNFLKAQKIGDISKHRGVWGNVSEQILNRTMPPPDADQPQEDERIRLAHWIDEVLESTVCEQGVRTRVVITRRLNATEYDYTMEDIFGLKMNLSASFPVDGSGGEGFDNNGETLFVPSMLLERYLEAADQCLKTVVVTKHFYKQFKDQEFNPQSQTNYSQFKIPTGDSEPAMFTTYDESDFDLTIDFKEPPKTKDAEGKEQVAYYQPGTLIVKLDGIKVATWKTPEVPKPVEVKPTAAADAAKEDKKAGEAEAATKTSEKKPEPAKKQSSKRPQEVIPPYMLKTTLHLTRGAHFLSLQYQGKEQVSVKEIQIYERRKYIPDDRKKLLANLHEQLFCGMKAEELPKTDPRGKATEIIQRLCRKAFRREVSSDEVQKYLGLYDRAANRGDPWDHSVKYALKAILISPNFLFRLEAPPKTQQAEMLGEYELASRLSYCLWCSCPDEELLSLAQQGRLKDEGILKAQIQRMIADPKSTRFSDRFVGQWLGTHEVGARVIPSTDHFLKQFTTELLLDMRDEPVWLFDDLLQKNDSLLELLDAKYVILTPRLKEHYKIETAALTDELNPRFKDDGKLQRINLENDQRGGILGMGGVHLKTSYPDRTSPVLRGGWVLETLLGVKIPPPPPNIPALAAVKKKQKKKLSVREQLEIHRDNASCAACHNLIDPVGFCLDNYDVLGRWRDKDEGTPIVPEGTLPTGEKMNGKQGLLEVLNQREHEVVKHAVRKLLGYTLGRTLEDSDDCTIDLILQKTKPGGYRVRDIVQEVLLSYPFRYQQASTQQ